MDQDTKIASDLRENAENSYQLVYEIADLAKRLVEESNQRKNQEEYGYEVEFNSSVKKEKPVQHAIMVKASENNDSGLVG